MTSHRSLDQARFVPGTMLLDRYRIVGLLGRGGMGEVYKADDLKLGQPVALKFLPAGFERNEQRLRRFLDEVKLARQVSHANVCRVYDLAEAEGQQFLSMEYVDGEDLASLLKRIGRLPADKAAQVARQTCAGLAAAHEQGILHRDLKPANVMIDGQGRAKIADFGLAGLEQAIPGGDLRSGTPGYMAPEQVEGREVTKRSDIYALGLVLYELFTGKSAFDAATPAELIRMQQESEPSSPSSHVPGLASSIDRIILCCLEKDPNDRPASALAVAAALPGGDPLAVALAAGDTPSPEMVADAGMTGALKPAIAAAGLAFTLAGLVALPFIQQRVSVLGSVSVESPPAVLAAAARQIIEEAGHTDPPLDSAYGFAYDGDYFAYAREQDAAVRWKDLADVRPAPIQFWFRQSPRHLVPIAGDDVATPVSRSDPPAAISGMAGVTLDAEGRLLRFYQVPPQVDASAGPGPEPDWSMLFERAGFELAAFSRVEATRTPLLTSDVRTAWEGTLPDRPDQPLRIEAGAWRGRPVFFLVVTPWDKPGRMEARTSEPGERAGAIILTVILFGGLLGALLLARRNIRLGRGDRRGAFRLAMVLFVAYLFQWVLTAHHRPAFAEIGLLFRSVARALLALGISWVVYIALEPYVRRLWPHAIISWNRVFRGRLRDPMVGRDILVGAWIGLAAMGAQALTQLVPEWLGLSRQAPVRTFLLGLEGIRQSASLYSVSVVNGLLNTVLFLFLLLLLRVLVRRQWLAIVVLLGIFSVPALVAEDWFGALGTLIFLGAIILALVRFGMLACVVTNIFMNAMVFYVLTFDVSSWYAGQSLFTLLVLAALVVYGFYVSLAGRGLFSEKLLEVEAAG